MPQTEPESWGDAIRQYEQEKRNHKPPPLENFPRYGRTQFCPFGATHRNDYSHPTEQHPVGPAELDKYKRTGLGGAHPTPYVINTITQRWGTEEQEARQAAQDAKELDCEGRMQVPGCAPGVGSNRPMPIGRDNKAGRANLFSHMSYAPGGLEHDTWVGNRSINPLEGKKGGFPPPLASQGRKDLFGHIGQAEIRPGEPNQDAWIGNTKVYPEEGKKATDAPNQGRKDLYGVIQQSATRPPGDTEKDAWIGHVKINPVEGKLKGAGLGNNDLTTTLRHDNPNDPMEPIGTIVQSGGRARGMKIWPQGHKDFNNFGNHIGMVPPEASELPLYENQARAKNRDAVPKAVDSSGRQNLFKVLHQAPDAVAYEASSSKKLVRPIPGSMKLHGGHDMLHWKE